MLEMCEKVVYLDASQPEGQPIDHNAFNCPRSVASIMSMRVELEKGSRYIVFTLGSAFGVADGDVKVYTYESHCRISSETYGITFARRYWKMLVVKGYRVVAKKVRETLPL